MKEIETSDLGKSFKGLISFAVLGNGGAENFFQKGVTF